MAKGHHYIRKFGGKDYRYQITFQQKAKAKMMADSYRRAGGSTRIVKTADGYDVYVRDKQTQAYWGDHIKRRR